jgi:hypothetical protein
LLIEAIRNIASVLIGTFSSLSRDQYDHAGNLFLIHVLLHHPVDALKSLRRKTHLLRIGGRENLR